MPPAADPHQANDFPADPFFRYVPRQPHNPALQNARVPPPSAHGQPDGLRDDIPLPVEGVAGPGRAPNPHHVGVAHQEGIIDYHPQSFNNPAYVFPDVGHVQGVPVQGQPGAPMNEHDLFGYFPQHVAPGPPQAAFPHQFVHGIPTPDQPRPEDLRRLASRYWYHPDAQVGMVSVEAGTTGQYKVVITLAMPIGF